MHVIDARQEEFYSEEMVSYGNSKLSDKSIETISQKRLPKSIDAMSLKSTHLHQKSLMSTEFLNSMLDLLGQYQQSTLAGFTIPLLYFFPIISQENWKEFFIYRKNPFPFDQRIYFYFFFCHQRSSHFLFIS